MYMWIPQNTSIRVLLMFLVFIFYFFFSPVKTIARARAAVWYFRPIDARRTRAERRDWRPSRIPRYRTDNIQPAAFISSASWTRVRFSGFWINNNTDIPRTPQATTLFSAYSYDRKCYLNSKKKKKKVKSAEYSYGKVLFINVRESAERAERPL